MTTSAPAAAQATAQANPLQPQLRAVRAADLPAMRQYVLGLSSDSRGLRFHGGVNPTSERLLTHLTQADGRRHIALVAVLACDDGDLIVGEARCALGTHGEPAEFAMSVADAWQGRGLARALLRALLAAAGQAGVDAVMGEVLSRNARMSSFMQREGFAAGASPEAGVQRWERRLVPVRPAPKTQPVQHPVAGGWAGWLARQLGWAAPTLPAA